MTAGVMAAAPWRGLVVSSTAALRRRAWIPWTIGVACATTVAFMFASQHVLYRRALGQPAPLGLLLLPELVRWNLWVAMAPAVFALAARARPDGHIDPWRAVRAALAAVGLALVHAGVSGVVDRWMAVRLLRTPAEPAAVQAMGLVVADVLVVAAMATVYYALAYHHRWRGRELQAAQLEAGLARARLELVRRRLQPHFLFNTLNGIAEVMHRDVAAADAMLGALCELLQASLADDADTEVALADELRVVERYLAIMRFRFGARVRTTVEADGEALRARVPTFVLQPLVENAFHHGIARRRGAGRVVVRARRAENALRVLVADDGPGLSEHWKRQPRDGIGLSTTRARLALTYGGAYRLELRDGEEGGTEVELVVPFRTAGPALDAEGR